MPGNKQWYHYRMKISDNNITINLDEAKYFASQKQTWNQDTIEDKKIAVGKAITELMAVVNKSNRNIAWDGCGEI